MVSAAPRGSAAMPPYGGQTPSFSRKTPAPRTDAHRAPDLSSASAWVSRSGFTGVTESSRPRRSRHKARRPANQTVPSESRSKVRQRANADNLDQGVQDHDAAHR